VRIALGSQGGRFPENAIRLNPDGHRFGKRDHCREKRCPMTIFFATWAILMAVLVVFLVMRNRRNT